MQKELIEKIPAKLSFEFSILILEYSDLLNEALNSPLASNWYRSGTSIGANSMEAQKCGE
jgi:hypothetical protein